MVLQLQGAGRRVRAIRGYPPVLGGAQEGGVIVHHDAVMQHGDVGGACLLYTSPSPRDS